jgi:K+:H+ antiporter
VLNPPAFTAVDFLKSRFDRKPQTGAAKALADSDDGLSLTRLSDHVVLVGHGRVGSIVSEAFRGKGMPFLVIEDASSRIAALREKRRRGYPPPSKHLRRGRNQVKSWT